MTDKVSVIIPTYQGAHKVVAALHSLANQSFTDFETVVIIDGSTDDTREKIQGMDFRMALKVVEQDNKGRSGAKNRGVEEAAGDLLIFMDDDMRFEPTVIDRHVRHHKAVPGSVLVGSALEELTPSSTEFQAYRAFKMDFWQNELHSYPEPMKDDKLMITAAHFSINRQQLKQLGSFNESLSDAEDFELAQRVKQKKIPVYFDKELVGWHDDPMDAWKYLSRLKAYSSGEGQVGPGEKPKTPLLKRLAFSMLISPSWIGLIDRGSLKFIPQKIRYRLYDAIFTAQSQ